MLKYTARWFNFCLGFFWGGEELGGFLFGGFFCLFVLVCLFVCLQILILSVILLLRNYLEDLNKCYRMFFSSERGVAVN